MRHAGVIGLACAAIAAAVWGAAGAGGAEPAAGGAYAGDRIMTFGGGPVAHHSQASLEQNVIYFRRVLKEAGLEGVKHDVFFTDGTGTRRTIEVKTPLTPEKDFRETLAAIFGDNMDGVQAEFRAPDVGELAGASTPEAVGKWFEATGKEMKARQRLLVYFTGHGGPLMQPGRRGGPAAVLPGTQLATWNNTSVTTKDFVGMLDKMDPGVEVTLVMVQCFSGGFANVIYKEGDPAKGFSAAHRCGFFSTVSTRPAAGCTADIVGDNYEEFSTSFFAALSGKTRAGKAVERPDYDHDGTTSFSEAFTYVILNSNTIDIPTCTSDQLLRDKSRFGKGNAADAGMLVRDAGYAAVMEAALPAQKAGLDGLSAILNVTGENRVAAVRTMATDNEKERAALQKSMRDSEAEVAKLSGQIRLAVENRWPELGVRWHPGTEGILAKEGKDIQAAVEGNAAYGPWKSAREKIMAAYEKDFELEKKWVKTQRFLMRYDTVILAANLQKAATPEAVEVYEALVKRENGTLGDWKGK